MIPKEFTNLIQNIPPYYFALCMRERFGGKIVYSPIHRTFGLLAKQLVITVEYLYIENIEAEWYPWDTYADYDAEDYRRVLKTQVLI